ncbi:MAG TPA: tetratricopeptide repeat protein [Candidatus Sulfotelmatobacter sp.]
MTTRWMLFKTGLLLAVCFGASLAPAATCAGPQPLEAKLHADPDVQTYIDLGTWFGDHRNYDCAVETFRAALKLEPGSAQLYYLVGLSLYSAGRMEDAVEPLGRSIYLLPEVLKPHLLLGAAYDRLQRRDEAKAQWEAALQIDPHSTEALDAVSKSLMADGDYASVIQLLRAVPYNEDLTLDLALAYGKSQMFDEADKILIRALRAHPASIRLSSALTTVYINQVRYQDAVHVAAQSARLHPHDLEAQRFYLRVLVLNGDLTVARPLARKLLAASPHDFYFLYLSGILENQAGQYTIARDHLTQAVALDPNHYNARYNLGVALLELKDFSGAKEQLQKAISLGGSEPEIRFKYAAALRSLGETDAAQEQLKLYQQQLQTSAKRALAANKIAQADKESATGDPQKAAALYREAFEATPDNAQLAFKLALALDKTGATDSERTVLEQAIKIDPSMALAQNQLGYLASRGGDPASAEEHFRLAVRAAPGYTQAWVSLAATLAMESRFPEAEEAVASALRLDPGNVQAQQLRKDLTAAQAQR